MIPMPPTGAPPAAGCNAPATGFYRAGHCHSGPQAGARPACDFPGLAATHAAALAIRALEDCKAHAIDLS